MPAPNSMSVLVSRGDRVRTFAPAVPVGIRPRPAVEGIVAQPPDEDVIAVAAVELVDSVTAGQGVIAAQAVEDVVARAAVEVVVQFLAVEGVVAAEAGDRVAASRKPRERVNGLRAVDGDEPVLDVGKRPLRAALKRHAADLVRIARGPLAEGDLVCRAADLQDHGRVAALGEHQVIRSDSRPECEDVLACRAGRADRVGAVAPGEPVRVGPRAAVQGVRSLPRRRGCHCPRRR